MSVAGLGLVLAAAFCHATWNLFVKRINAGPELIWLFSALMVLIYSPVAIWIIAVEDPVFGVWQAGFVVASTVLHLGYLMFLQTGYRKGDLSLVYPIARATGPLVATSLAVLLLGEIISVQMAVGAGIIIFGVLMLTGGVSTGAKHLSASLPFGLGAGILIGCYTVCDAYAVSILALAPLILEFASGILRVTILTPVAIRKRRLIRQLWQKHKAGVIVIAVFNPLAYILVLYALTFTPVAYVAPMRETSVLLTVLAGSLLLNEGRLGQRLGWSVFILGGMILLVSSES